MFENTRRTAIALLFVTGLVAVAGSAAAEEDEDFLCGCPREVSALPQDDGNLIEWSFVADSEGYFVYRAVNDGAFEKIATVPDRNITSLKDTDVVVGETYRYQVTAFVGDFESSVCDSAEATAIPVFPTIVAGALATMLGIGAYTVSRRR